MSESVLNIHKTIAFHLALLLDLNNIYFVSWAAVLVPATIMVLLLVGAVIILGAIAIRQTCRHRSVCIVGQPWRWRELQER
ncbi:MAG: hypothetical protein AB8B64_21130 [Granulosicoccus sp.]